MAELVATAGAFLASNAGTITAIATVGQTLAGIASARTNANFLEAEAESARQAGEANAENRSRQVARAISKNENIRAASGLDTTSGTSLAQLLDEVKEGELDVQTIRHRGELKRRSKLTEAKLARQSIPGLVFGGAASLGRTSGLSQLLSP